MRNALRNSLASPAAAALCLESLMKGYVETSMESEVVSILGPLLLAPACQRRLQMLFNNWWTQLPLPTRGDLLPTLITALADHAPYASQPSTELCRLNPFSCFVCVRWLPNFEYEQPVFANWWLAIGVAYPSRSWPKGKKPNTVFVCDAWYRDAEERERSPRITSKPNKRSMI